MLRSALALGLLAEAGAAFLSAPSGFGALRPRAAVASQINMSTKRALDPMDLTSNKQQQECPLRPYREPSEQGGLQTATFALGVCSNPEWQDWAEAVQVDFDPKLTSYEDLLNLFWKSHTFEMGSGKRQYMSAIFAHNEEQLEAARVSHAQKVSEKKGRVSTVVEEATDFWEAEAYHQKWLLQRKANWFRALELSDAREMIESPAACRLNAYAGQAIDAAAMVRYTQGWGEKEGVTDEVRQNVLRRLKLEG